MKKIIALLFFLFGAALIFFISFYPSIKNNSKKPIITTYEQCVAAGYPVMQSSPRQCGVPGGRLFIEQVVYRECQSDAQCLTGQVCNNHICKN